MIYEKKRPLRNGLFLFLLIALSFSNTFAQNLSIKGNITSQDDGLPLAGVNILIANTNKGALSDFDGNYTLRDVPTDAILIVSYLGFETQSIKVNNRRTIDVVMVESTESLDEVVVIGYGTSKKSELTEAVSSVKSDEIVRSTGTSIESALQGRLSGVRVISNEGTPGGGLNINVRGTTTINGSNDPLYVIDGVPILKENIVGDSASDGLSNLPADPLSGINPSDIASIEVLKDASATAIYGSRGANGVVIITTKKGKTGKLKIDYDGAFGVSVIANELELLDAPGYYEYRFLKDPNDGIFANEDNRNFIDPNGSFNANGLGIDWQDVVYREAYLQNHRIGFSGGGETVRFYTSLGYMDQEGIIVDSEFKRYSGLANINVDTEKFRMDANINFSQSFRNGAIYASGGPSNNTVGTVNKIFYANPLGDDERVNDAIFDEGIEDEDEFFTNPFLFATEAQNDNVQTRLTGNVTAYFDIAKNLEVQARIGGNVNFNSQEQYLPRETTGVGRRLNGYAQITKTDATRFLFENLLRYKLEKNKHNLKVMAGYSLEKGTRKILRTANQGFILDNTGVFNIGLGTDLIPPSTRYIEQSLNSYLSRINYNYKGKYFLTLTGRVDGSSKFPVGNKYAFFPSGAVAWNVHKENFLKKSNIINNLKLRYSIGATGNQAIPAYSSLDLLDDVTYSFGGGIQTGLVFSQLANENLKWETVYQNNLGIDLGLFNNKVSVFVDAFIKKTEDALLAVPVSSVIGLSDNTPFQNIGEIENKGIEFSVNTTNIQSKKFSWHTNFNLSFTKNRVVSLGEISEFFAGFGDDVFTDIIAYREGGEIGEFHGFKTDGIILNQEELDAAPNFNLHKVGSWRLKDISGPEGVPDGEIDDFDRTIIGSSQPDFFGGITNNFNIGNLDLSFFFEFSVGQELYNANNVSLLNPYGNRNKLASVLDEVTRFDSTTGDLIKEGSLPAAGVVADEIRSPLDAFVEDASYLRLQNVTLGYTIPLAKQLNITKLRVYLSANNLWLLTDYSGYDPDVNATRNSGLVRGVDFGTYPKNRNIIWGVNLTF